MIPKLDAWLRNYGKLAKTVSEKADPDYPGAGAAGGLGFAFLTFTNATLEPGVEIILSETGLEEKIRSADIVVTGEGRLDRQTVMGKAPMTSGLICFIATAIASLPESLSLIAIVSPLLISRP